MGDGCAMSLVTRVNTTGRALLRRSWVAMEGCYGDLRGVVTTKGMGRTGECDRCVNGGPTGGTASGPGGGAPVLTANVQRKWNIASWIG